MIELPLAVIDGRIASSCIRSGFCCKQAPCPFGTWDEDKKQCAHLEGDKPGEYRCGIAELIVTQPGWELAPAFGAGCCSVFNRDRQELIRRTTR